MSRRRKKRAMITARFTASGVVAKAPSRESRAAKSSEGEGSKVGAGNGSEGEAGAVGIGD